MTDINSIDREKSRSDEPIFDSNLKKRLIPSSVTKTLETHDGELTYTATAGYLDLFEENIGHEIAQEATVKARVFLTTYVAQNTSHESSDEGSASRPVIFLFNGGPGSSSAWLHLGLFGPRIVNPVEKDGTTPLAPPYHLRITRIRHWHMRIWLLLMPYLLDIQELFQTNAKINIMMQTQTLRLLPKLFAYGSHSIGGGIRLCTLRVNHMACSVVPQCLHVLPFDMESI